MKRFLTALLAIVLMSTTACGAASQAGPQDALATELRASSSGSVNAKFSDVPGDVWYGEAVAYCTEHDMMEGTSASTFSPEAPMTRAMLAAVFYRMADSPETADAPRFSDTAGDAWYSKAVAWAAGRGVMSGYGSGIFGVDDALTREQMATVLWRYAGSPALSTEAEPFSDARAIAAWAQTAVIWAKASGIITGKSENRFDPNTIVTRGEVAVMLYRWLDETSSGDSRVLVAYFSATGSTKRLAEYAVQSLDAELYEIVPKTAYTPSDLEYTNASSRANQEQRDPNARPAIQGSVLGMVNYDIIFLGYPIWHGQAPKLMRTFLERYDFSGKTIVPFCTSHSSGIGSSAENLHTAAPGADWISGRQFSVGTSQAAMKSWIDELDLPEIATPPTTAAPPFDFERRTVTLNSGYEMPINGLGTHSLHDDVCINSVTAALNSGVRLIDTAHAYGNEKEIGQAIRASGVPREEIFVITKLYPDQFSGPQAAIQEALQNLDIGYIDMMLLHHPGTGDVAAYKAMEQAVADGKIRSIGLSNWYVKELGEFLPQVSITPALVQNEIHPYYQENDVIPDIQSLGIVVQGWYPLGGRGHTAQLLGDSVISEIAAAHKKSSAQVILRWNLQKGVVVIPGSSNPEHIEENTQLYDFALTDGEMARINALDRGEKHDWY